MNETINVRDYGFEKLLINAANAAGSPIGDRSLDFIESMVEFFIRQGGGGTISRKQLMWLMDLSKIGYKASGGMLVLTDKAKIHLQHLLPLLPKHWVGITDPPPRNEYWPSKPLGGHRVSISADSGLAHVDLTFSTTGEKGGDGGHGGYASLRICTGNYGDFSAQSETYDEGVHGYKKSESEHLSWVVITGFGDHELMCLEAAIVALGRHIQFYREEVEVNNKLNELITELVEYRKPPSIEKEVVKVTVEKPAYVPTGMLTIGEDIPLSAGINV